MSGGLDTELYHSPWAEVGTSGKHLIGGGMKWEAEGNTMSQEITFDDISGIEVDEMNDGSFRFGVDESRENLVALDDFEGISEGDVLVWEGHGEHLFINTVEEAFTEEGVFDFHYVVLDNGDEFGPSTEFDFWLVPEELLNTGSEEDGDDSDDEDKELMTDGGQDRDAITSVESSTDYSIPDAYGYDLGALPAFVGEGWVQAREESDGVDDLRVIVEDEERGLKLEFFAGYEAPLDELPEGNAHHLKSRGEKGNSGHGETLIAGDFYLDWRRDNRRWTGMGWEGGHTEARVRLRPDAPNTTTVVANAEKIVERKADSKGRLTLGADFADKNVRVAVLEADDEN